jgi:hypothetical protein
MPNAPNIPDGPRRLDAEIRFLLGRNERAAIERLARSHDRTLSAEVRHALRLYVNQMRTLTSRDRTGCNGSSAR